MLPLTRYDTAADVVPEALADAVTDGLIAELARHAAVEVASRTSVMPFRDRQASLSTIASELGVQAVVEGSHPGHRHAAVGRGAARRRPARSQGVGRRLRRRHLRSPRARAPRRRRPRAGPDGPLRPRRRMNGDARTSRSLPGGTVAKKKASTQPADDTLGSIAEGLGSLLGNAEKQWRAWQGPRDAVVKAVSDVRDRAVALLSEMDVAGLGSDKGKKTRSPARRTRRRPARRATRRRPRRPPRPRTPARPTRRARKPTRRRRRRPTRSGRPLRPARSSPHLHTLTRARSSVG